MRIYSDWVDYLFAHPPVFSCNPACGSGGGSDPGGRTVVGRAYGQDAQDAVVRLARARGARRVFLIDLNPGRLAMSADAVHPDAALDGSQVDTVVVDLHYGSDLLTCPTEIQRNLDGYLAHLAERLGG